MTQDTALKILLTYLGCYRISELLLDELLEAIVGSGYESAFFKTLMHRLQVLTQMGVMCTQLPDAFENIGSGLFSIRMIGKGFNIRILFAFLPSKEPVLLRAFYERSGKAKTNYSEQIPVALDRLKAIKEEQ